MNRQRDLFELFRENQRSLDERPSLQTWRRLERRLDAHQRRGRISLYRSLGMVAGVLALVAMIILISMVVDRQQQYLTGAPQELEVLTSSDADPTAYQVVEFTRQYRDYMRKAVEEGTMEKKLVPAEKE